jgi:hypothetical protein
LINFNVVNTFNEWISRWGLIDIKDPTRTFTWSNNQECPIMATLDRILMTVEWKAKYPLAMVNMLAKGVIDHNPLMISFGEKMLMKDPIFRFEKWWLEIEEFADLVRGVWDIDCPYSEPMEIWQFKIRTLRRKLKGWSRNLDVDIKKKLIY